MNKNKTIKGTILIVEDEGAISLDIQNSLKDFGYGVAGIAQTGKEALEMAATATPNLVLMDIVLRGKMDGIETAKRIHSLYGIPCIFLTAYADEERIEKAKDAQPFGYILKPFNKEELRAAIEMAFFRLSSERKTGVGDVEHKRIDDLMKASELRYRRLFEAAKDGILILDYETGKIVDVNPFLIHALRFPKNKFIGKQLWQLGFFKNIAKNKSNFLKLKREKYIRYENLPLETADGRKISAEFVSNVYDVGGQKVIQCSIRDVTERKTAEDVLAKSDRKKSVEDTKASELRYRRLFEAGRDGNLILDYDTGKVIDVNPFLTDLLGFPKKWFVGKQLWELGAFKDIAQSKANFLKLKKNRSVHYDNLPMETADGRKISVEFYTNVFGVGKKKVIQCNIRDISERRRREEEASRMATVVRDSNDAITIQDFDGKINAWNRGAELMYGYGEKEAKRKSIWQLTPPNKAAEQRKFTRRLLAGEKVTSFETQRVTKDGRLLDVWMVLTKLMDDAGKVIGIASTERDITERKRGEDEASRMATVVRDSNDAITIQDFDGKITAWNRGAELMYGYTQKEALRMKIWQLTPSDKAAEQKDFNRRLLAGEKVTSFETQRLTKDGRLLDVWMVVTKLTDDAGKVIGIASTERNITQSKREAEEASRMATVVRDSNDAITIQDFKGKILAWNRGATLMYGYGEKEAKRKSIWQLTPPNKVAEQRKFTRRLLAGEKVSSLETQRKTKDGRLLDVWMTVTKLMDDAGKVIGIASTERDITERRRNDDEMKASELRFRRLFEAGRDGNLILDYDTGKVIDVNPFMIELLGFTKEGFVGKQLWELGAFKDIAQSKANFLKLKRKRYVRYENLPMETADGRKISVEFVSNVFGVGSKKVIQCNVRDMTERIKAENDLKKSHQELEKRVEERTSELAFKNAFLNMELKNSIDGTLIDDPQGKILSTSPRYAEMWNIPPSLLRTKDSKKLLYFVSSQLQDPDEYVNEVKRLYSHKDEKGRALIKFKDGRVFDRNTSPLVGENGKHYGRLWSFRDMSAEAAVDRAKNELVSLASHQLRTPLTGTKWLIQMVLKRGGLNPWQTEFIGDALKSNERMIKLVGDLLNISRLEAGVIGFSPHKTKVAVFLDATVKEIEMENREKGLKIIFRRPARGLAVMLDPNLIRQVVINLLSNAVKYSPNGKSVTLSAQVLKNNLEISIKDHGIGISNADQKKLFTKFFRSEEAARIDTKGSGLGLYILRKILDVCHGQISCQSTAGKGSTFTISLPLRGFRKTEGMKELIVHDIS